MTEAVKPPTKNPLILTQYDKDRRLFELVGATCFEGMSNDDYETQLHELNLAPLRFTQEHNFQLGMKDEYKGIYSMIGDTQTSYLSVGPEDEIWHERPLAFTPEGEALWVTFQQDATETAWRQLLDGTHSSQSQRAPPAAQAGSKNLGAESSSVAVGPTSAAAPRDSSKRIRKPNSRFSDYEQDEPSRTRKRSSGTAAVASLAKANYSDDSFADGNYNYKDEPDPDDEDQFSEEEEIAASDFSPARSKGKKKASAPTVKKAKPPRKMNHQERKEYNNALRGRDGSDDSSSEDDDDGDDNAPGPSNRRKRRRKGTRRSTSATHLQQAKKARKSEPEVIEIIDEEEDEDAQNVTRFFRHVKTTTQNRHRNKTGAQYTVIVEKWECRFCGNHYTGHPTNRSNLSLHLNPKTSKSPCKRLYNPIDKSLLGVFKPPVKKVEQAQPAGAPIVDNIKDGTSSFAGLGQRSLDSWVNGQRHRAHEVQASVVRQKALLWVIMDALPFTAPSSPWLKALIMAASPVAVQGLMSARTIVTDLERFCDSLLDQALKAIKRGRYPFAILQDAWSSPSQRHTFVAFVVTYLDSEWKYCQFVLDFAVLRGRHGGATFAAHLVRALKRHGIYDLWTGILVVDAASSNGRMSSIIEQESAVDKVLDEDLDEPVEFQENSGSGQPVHRQADHVIYCFNHALNRAMQDLYRVLGVSCADGTGVLGAAPDGAEEDVTIPTKATKLPPSGDNDDEAASSGEDDDGEAAGESEDEEGEGVEAAKGASTQETGTQDAGTQDAETGEVVGFDDDDDIFVDPKEARAALSLMRDLRQLPPIPEEEDEAGEEATQSELEQEDPSSDELLQLSGPLEKIARFAKIVHSSSESKREFVKLMKMIYRGDGKSGKAKKQAKKQAKAMPPKLNHTRWNSRFEQLHFAIKVPEGYNFVCKNSKRQGPNGYTDLTLSDREFSLLENIHDIGEYVQERTYEFEKDDGHACKMLARFAVLVHVLTIEINSAKEKLNGPTRKDPFAKDKDNGASDLYIQGMEKMRTKIRRYQSLAANTKSIIIATALHPKYRLSILERDYPGLATRARSLIEDEVAQYVSLTKEPAHAILASPSPKKDKWKRAPVAGLEAHVIPKNSDVEAYFGGRYPWQGSAPGPDADEDVILGWWRDNEKNLPVLSKVARKYLCAPASTSAVERVFSRAGRYVSNRRPLGPTTLRHLVISNSLILGGCDPNAAFDNAEAAAMGRTAGRSNRATAA
ncbi:hypothetical protein CF326_g5474 [Tilletia indica]|nr:hypothetical protein CF326_g5474 [Tilletia indica]